MDAMRAEKAHAASLSGYSEARLPLVVIGDHVLDVTVRGDTELLSCGDPGLGRALVSERLPGGVA
jgi:hypothetical protein